eukprot:UN01835
MLMYFLIICSAAYCYGRHRGEYIRETKSHHKVCMWFMSYLLPYILTISWIYYNVFHSSNNINYIGINFPWLTLYGISYFFYSIISTFSFAYHSNYDHASVIQFVCLFCTVFPLGVAILTIFLFQKSQDVKSYKFGLFDMHSKVPICFNIDLFSLCLSCLLIIAFCHHIYVLFRVFSSMISDKKDYLSHPYAYRGKVSNISRSTTAALGRKPPNGKIYGGMKQQYVYKSEDSESDGLCPHEQENEEIEINVQIANINEDEDEIDDEVIELNHSIDVRRSNSLYTTGSVSYDL